VAHLSGHDPRETRRDTPTPGWQSGVWVRIQHQRRNRHVAVLVVTAAVSVAGALAVVPRVPEKPRPLRVSAVVHGTVRPDGSAPLHTQWQLTFEGAELRVYRNALGAVHRCPGSPGCIPSGPGGRFVVPVDTPGEYRALVFSRSLSGDGGTLEEDFAAARARSQPAEMSPSLLAY